MAEDSGIDWMRRHNLVAPYDHFELIAETLQTFTPLQHAHDSANESSSEMLARLLLPLLSEVPAYDEHWTMTSAQQEEVLALSSKLSKKRMTALAQTAHQLNEDMRSCSCLRSSGTGSLRELSRSS